MTDFSPAIPGDTYQVGGSLPVDAPSYVRRQADEALYQALKAGEFCYVLNSRQMGKSSLKVQTIRRLQAEGVACAAIDLTQIGSSDITPDQWYNSLIDSIVNSLDLYDRFDLYVWWEEHSLLSNVRRLGKFLDEVLLPSTLQTIVIFIDEIDSILSLPFPMDDFFALIRECYNRRADNPGYNRLTFTLLGVTTPTDLIQNKQRTPFNVGRPIELAGFQLHEVEPLTQGLAAKTTEPQALMQAVLDWTGGQPFLTQKVCRLLLSIASAAPAGQAAIWVDQLIHTKIIENWEAQDTPQHLITIRDRLLNTEERAGRLLGLYQQIVQQGEIVADNSPEQIELRLTGLIVKRDGKLRDYNRIYREVFSRDWLERSLSNLRPYGRAITTWLESDRQDESRLLRGQALQEARTWAEGKRIDEDDRRFLDASQELEKRDIQRKLEVEAEAKQVLTAANRQANQRIQLGSAALALMLVGAITSGLAAQNSIKGANETVKAVEKKAEQFQADADIAEQRRINSDTQRQFAEQRKQSAEAQARQAVQNLRRAEQREADAMRQYTIAQIQATQAQQDRAYATQAATQARDSAAQAKTDQQRTRLQLEDAKINLLATEVRLKSTVANERFAAGRPFESLLTALAAGQQLQQVIKTVLGKDDTQARVIAALDQAMHGVNERNTLTGHQNLVANVSFSPDGKTLLSGSEDGNLKLWSTDSGVELRTIVGHQEGITSVDFSPDGKTVASSSWDDTIKVWNVDTGEEIRTLYGHEDYVTHASFSPDGKTIASSSLDGTIKVWNVDTGEEIRTLYGHEDYVTHASFSPDGKTIVSSSRDKTVKLWSVGSGEEIRTFSGHQNFVTSVSFSPDGQVIVSSSWDKTVKLWNVGSGEEIRTFSGHQGFATSVSFSPDGKTLASGSGDNTVKLWSLDNGASPHTLSGHKDSVTNVSFSPDGKTLASGSSDNTVKLWSLDSGTELITLRGHRDSVTSVSFSPDGKTIASGSYDNIIKLWSIDSREEIRTFLGHRRAVMSVSFSPDGKTLASGSSDNTVKLWSLDSRALPRTLSGHKGSVTSVSFSPDGKTIISGSNDGTVKLWKVSDGAELLTFRGHRDSVKVTSVSFNPDGKTIISGSNDNTIKLWKVDDGAELLTFRGHEDSVTSVSFSPDGKTIISGSTDGTLRLWEAGSGEEIQTLSINPDAVTSVSFSPDGKMIGSGYFDGFIELKVWDFDRLMTIGCDWIRGYLISHPVDRPLCERYLIHE